MDDGIRQSAGVLDSHETGTQSIKLLTVPTGRMPDGTQREKQEHSHTHAHNTHATTQKHVRVPTCKQTHFSNDSKRDSICTIPNPALSRSPARF